MSPHRMLSAKMRTHRNADVGGVDHPSHGFCPGRDCAARGRAADAGCWGGDAGHACAHAHARAHPDCHADLHGASEPIGAGANLSGRQRFRPRGRSFCCGGRGGPGQRGGIGRAEGCAGRPSRRSRADPSARRAARTDRCAAARHGDGRGFGVEQAEQLRQHGCGRAFCRGVGLSAGERFSLAALRRARAVADAHSALAPPSRSPAGLFDRRVRQRVGR